MASNDETSTLLGQGPPKNDIAITTGVDDGIDVAQRRQTYGKKLRVVASNTVVHLIWMISFFIVFGKTDSTTCTGTLYHFGELARWFLLGFVVWDIVEMTTMKYLQKYSHRYNSPPKIYNILELAYLAISLLFWIYSIVALNEREGCEGQSLTTLVWIWVFLYAILPCIYVSCLCLGAIIIDSYWRREKEEVEEMDSNEQEKQRAFWL
mgnify:FL=1